MKLPQFLFAALITAAFVPNLAAAAGTGLPQMVTKELVALDKQREKELAVVRVPFVALADKYVAALKRAAQSAQAAGDLKKVLAVENEIQRVEGGEQAAEALGDPELERLRKVYQENLAKLEARDLPKLVAVERHHADGLKAIVAELTQAGMIAEAKEVFRLEQAAREKIKNLETFDSKPLALNPKKAPKGFVLVPAGKFEMGDHLDGDNNAPVHTVYVSAFYIAKHEVTKPLWDEVRKWALKKGYSDLPEGGGKDKDHPVHTVSWYDVVKWCNARSEKEGLQLCYQVDGKPYKTGDRNDVTCDWSAKGYRLPTEAEWEKAARGGLQGKRFPLGDTISHKDANFNNNGKEPYQSGTTGRHPEYSRTGTSPVGSFAANGYGIYDMAGNVTEWCWDWYSKSFDFSSSATDPRGPLSGKDRMFRGGSLANLASGCRAVKRYEDAAPTVVNGLIGFRLARTALP